MYQLYKTYQKALNFQTQKMSISISFTEHIHTKKPFPITLTVPCQFLQILLSSPASRNRTGIRCGFWKNTSSEMAGRVRIQGCLNGENKTLPFPGILARSNGANLLNVYLIVAVTQCRLFSHHGLDKLSESKMAAYPSRYLRPNENRLGRKTNKQTQICFSFPDRCDHSKRYRDTPMTAGRA